MTTIIGWASVAADGLLIALFGAVLLVAVCSGINRERGNHDRD